MRRGGGKVFSDGTDKGRGRGGGRGPAPPVRLEAEAKCFGLTGNRDEEETRRGCAGRYAGWRPGLVCERSAPLASLPLTVTIATRIATIRTVHPRTGAKLPP